MENKIKMDLGKVSCKSSIWMTPAEYCVQRRTLPLALFTFLFLLPELISQGLCIPVSIFMFATSILLDYFQRMRSRIMRPQHEPSL
jgi:hypothetical protein